MNNVNYFKARQWAFSFIKAHHKEQEAADLLLCGQMNWNETDLLLHFRDPMSHEEWEQYQENVKKFVEGWPAQYLIGEAYFYGLKLKVTPATLIPRSETEELVEWILQDFDQAKIDVLDIGTGTGAIGLALKTNRPKWQMTLADISASALEVARINAMRLKQNVTMVESDLFEKINDQFDVIVSNPPYIADDERPLMDQSVLEHEPEQALFAENHGLAIYQRIVSECALYLKEHATMYFEIGFQQGEAVAKIFATQFPQAQIKVKQDINGHDRMVRVKF